MIEMDQRRQTTTTLVVGLCVCCCWSATATHTAALLTQSNQIESNRIQSNPNRMDESQLKQALPEQAARLQRVEALERGVHRRLVRKRRLSTLHMLGPSMVRTHVSCRLSVEIPEFIWNAALKPHAGPLVLPMPVHHHTTWIRRQCTHTLRLWVTHAVRQPPPGGWQKHRVPRGAHKLPMWTLRVEGGLLAEEDGSGRAGKKLSNLGRLSEFFERLTVTLDRAREDEERAAAVEEKGSKGGPGQGGEGAAAGGGSVGGGEKKEVERVEVRFFRIAGGWMGLCMRRFGSHPTHPPIHPPFPFQWVRPKDTYGIEVDGFQVTLSFPGPDVTELPLRIALHRRQLVRGPARLPARLPVCLPACLPACLPSCLSAFLPACLPAFLPACLPACLPALCSQSRHQRRRRTWRLALLTTPISPTHNPEPAPDGQAADARAGQAPQAPAGGEAGAGRGGAAGGDPGAAVVPAAAPRVGAAGCGGGQGAGAAEFDGDGRGGGGQVDAPPGGVEREGGG